MYSSLFYTCNPQTLQTVWVDRVTPSLYEQLESWHVHSWLPSVHKGGDVTHKVLVPRADLLGSLHWGMSCFLSLCMIEWPCSLLISHYLFFPAVSRRREYHRQGITHSSLIQNWKWKDKATPTKALLYMYMYMQRRLEPLDLSQLRSLIGFIQTSLADYFKPSF